MISSTKVYGVVAILSGMLLAASQADMWMWGDPQEITADGVSTSTISAYVFEPELGTNGIPGVSVYFVADGPGTLSTNNPVFTDAFGMALIELTAGTTAGEVLISADTLANGANVTLVTLRDPANEAPSVDAGPNQTIELSESAILNATASDDGIPQPTLSVEWYFATGPGLLSFGNRFALNTTVAFSAPGVYTLHIWVSDGELSATDTVTITVNAPNAAPVVDAGSNQSITLPANASLNGTVTDDGLPSNSVFTTWSKVSGPGSVTFGNAYAIDTTAGFSTDGMYVLQLRADDGNLQSSDMVTITVNPEPPQNQAPSVDAGNDFSQKWAKNTWYPLNGTISDDGLPGPYTLSWSKVSGPGNVVFSNANSEDTTAKFGKRGTYVLQLTADDGELTADDTITVTMTKQ